MDNDDKLIGRILTRREMLALLGATGLAALTGCASPRSAGAGLPAAATSAAAPPPACVVQPALTEGPFFVNERLDRKDIRVDASTGRVTPGAPLELAFRISLLNASACTPLSGVAIDVWHCDADGRYSDVNDGRVDTRGSNFLRGLQVTDETGFARFTTIYPGWYPGRAVHIHYKLRTTTAAGKTFEFTSQLFFDEALTDRVHAQDPYAAKGMRNVKNENDAIFRSGGARMILPVESNDAGYAGVFDVAITLPA